MRGELSAERYHDSIVALGLLGVVGAPSSVRFSWYKLKKHEPPVQELIQQG